METQQAQVFIERFGFGLIAVGIFIAIANWGFLVAHLKLKRQGAKRNISMVFLIGSSLPLGFLFVDALRPHALWIWLIDPACAFLVGSPLHNLIQEILSRRQN